MGELVLRLGCSAHRRPSRVAALRANAHSSAISLRVYGTALARTHVAADASIIWPPSLFAPGSLSGADFSALAGATIAMQRARAMLAACRARWSTFSPMAIAPYARSRFLLPAASVRPDHGSHATCGRHAASRITPIRPASHRRVVSTRFGASRKASDVTLLLANDSSYGFIVAINPSGVRRRIGAMRIRLANRTVVVAGFDLRAPRCASHSGRAFRQQLR